MCYTYFGDKKWGFLKEKRKFKDKKDDFPWLNGKSKTLTIDEINDIEEFLED